MKKYFAIISTALLLGSCADKPQQSQGDGEEARFVDSVVARMDLKQKIGQLVQFVGSPSRTGTQRLPPP